ncbi:hypothetical protein pb186bvf_002064 [Paramecium bursaria]
MFLVFYISLVTSQEVQLYRETIKSENYSKEVKESLRLDYWAYPGVFAIDLYKRKPNSTTQQLDLEEFEIQEQDVLNTEGCYAQQRSINMMFQTRLQLGQQLSPDVYFTDVATAELFTRIYLVRNDFELFEIDLGVGLTSIDLNPVQKSFADLIPKGEVDIPIIIDDDGLNRVYILTENGAISFSTNKSISELEFQVETSFIKRTQITDTHYVPKIQLLIIGIGTDGIDIYDASTSKLIHRNQLDKSTLLLSTINVLSINIIGVSSNEMGDQLILLDKEYGLLFYSMKDINNPLYIYGIQITNARHFDHHGNTFFVVARTVTQQDYAVEIFVDLENRKHYFNTYYIDEMTINDVSVFDHYAILVGEDGHKIVYHSIYNDFIDEDFQIHTSFQENMTSDQIITSQYRLLVGLAKHSFKYFEIELEIPHINCRLDEVKSEYYWVVLNSTQCNQKQEKNDISPYSMCTVMQQFQFNALQVQGNYTLYSKYMLIAYVVFVVLVWATVLACALCKRWGYVVKMLTFKRKQKEVSEAYAPQDDVKDIKTVELTQSV